MEIRFNVHKHFSNTKQTEIQCNLTKTFTFFKLTAFNLTIAQLKFEVRKSCLSIKIPVIPDYQ